MSIRTRSGSTGRRADRDEPPAEAESAFAGERERRYALSYDRRVDGGDVVADNTRSLRFGRDDGGIGRDDGRRGWRGAVGSALVLLVLVSCSTGDARDERKFQAQEAERTQQVPAAQQTELADTFFQPTGTPVATLTPGALLSELVITTSLDASGAPSTDLSSVPRGSQIILAARLTRLLGGETITVEWLNGDGAVLASQDQAATATNGPKWFSSTWQPGGVPPGTYAAAVRVNGQLLNSIVFRIG